MHAHICRQVSVIKMCLIIPERKLTRIQPNFKRQEETPDAKDLEAQYAETVDRVRLESTLRLEMSRGMNALEQLGDDLSTHGQLSATWTCGLFTDSQKMLLCSSMFFHVVPFVSYFILPYVLAYFLPYVPSLWLFPILLLFFFLIFFAFLSRIFSLFLRILVPCFVFLSFLLVFFTIKQLDCLRFCLFQ